MKLILSFAILFGNIQLSYSLTATPAKIYISNQTLPIEISYLISSLQKNHSTKNEKNKFANSISKLDQLFQKLNKEELFFIIKSESYKTILKIKPEYQIKESFYQDKSLKVFDKYFKSETISSFSQWIVKSIYYDIKNIYNSSVFTTYMFRKKNNAVLTKEYIVVDKKLKILLPWISYLGITQPNQFEEDMYKYMTKLFEKLLIYSEQYLKFSQFDKLEISPLNKNLRFFTLETPHLKSIKDKNVRIENILLDPDEFLVDEDVKESGWMPKDDTKGAKLLKTPIPTPDPDYVPPEKLPESTSDWIDSF